MKSNDDLEKYKEILIFPYYIDENGNASLISEFDLQHKYPYAYHYLESKKTYYVIEIRQIGLIPHGMRMAVHKPSILRDINYYFHI